MIFDSQLIFIQRISPIPFYIFLLMNQNSCFIAAKIILILFINFGKTRFFCFFVPRGCLMYSFAPCSRSNSLLRTVKASGRRFGHPMLAQLGHSDFGIFLNCFQDMVFNVIQQKIFTIDRDKLFIQGTKTKKS